MAEAPATLQQAPDLTLELETTSHKPAVPSSRRTFTRTARHIHIQLHGANAEWLFVRNPVDGRRVSGTRIDHEHKALVEYSETELRAGNIAASWLHVASVGVTPEALAALSPTGRQEVLGGVVFAEYAPAGGGGAGSSIWWSTAVFAPLRVEADDTSPRLVVKAIRTSVDGSVLADPRLRFPRYAVIDVADFREQHRH
jgi:hypothetical protein